MRCENESNRVFYLEVILKNGEQENEDKDSEVKIQRRGVSNTDNVMRQSLLVTEDDLLGKDDFDPAR